MLAEPPSSDVIPAGTSLCDQEGLSLRPSWKRVYVKGEAEAGVADGGSREGLVAVAPEAGWGLEFSKRKKPKFREH